MRYIILSLFFSVSLSACSTQSWQHGYHNMKTSLANTFSSSEKAEEIESQPPEAVGGIVVFDSTKPDPMQPNKPIIKRITASDLGLSAKGNSHLVHSLDKLDGGGVFTWQENGGHDHFMLRSEGYINPMPTGEQCHTMSIFKRQSEFEDWHKTTAEFCRISARHSWQPVKIIHQDK